MFALELCCFSHQCEVDWDQFDGQLFQKMEGFSSSSRANLTLDDVEELTPIDPVQESFGFGPLLLIQSSSDLFPTRLFVNRLTRAKLSSTSFLLMAGFLSVLGAEVVRQGELAGEEAGHNGNRVGYSGGNDHPTAFFNQLDFATGFEPKFSTKLQRNQIRPFAEFGIRAWRMSPFTF